MQRACKDLIGCAYELKIEYTICYAYVKLSRSAPLGISKGDAKRNLLLAKETLAKVEQ